MALAPHRLPRSSQLRVAGQTGLRALLDEAELLGSAAPSPATAGGSITLGGTDNGQARAPAVTAGVVLAGGTATAQARATTAGSITLGGSATGAATGTGVQYVSGSSTSSGASAVTSMAIAGPGGASTFAIFYASRASGTATGTMTGVTDTSGNTWVRATRGGVSGASNTRIEIWYCENYTPATTITGAGPSFISAWGVAGFSGLVNASSLDVATADYASGSAATTITAPSITTSQSDLIFAADSHTTDATGALQSPFIQLSTYSLNGGGGGQAGYLIAPTAGTYTATWTQSTASSAGVAVVGFKAATVTGTPATAAGAITLGGTVTARAPVTALGSVALGGTPVARGAASAVTGSITLGGTAVPLDSPGSILNIGPGAANHFDVQVAPTGAGSIATHTQAEIAAGYTEDPYFKSVSTPQGPAVEFYARLDAPTTSGSLYSRSELREVTTDGSNMGFDINVGTHDYHGFSRVIHSPPTKPDIVMAQIHNGNADRVALRTQIVSGTTRLRLRVNGSSVNGDITNPYVNGTWVEWRFLIQDGALTVWVNDMVTPFYTAAAGVFTPVTPLESWYGKAGCYNQSQAGVDDVGTEYGQTQLRGLTVSHTAPATGAGVVSGSITLGGTAAAQARITAAGSISLGGAVTPAAPAVATGSLTLAGAVAAQAPVAAVGGISLGGAAPAQAGAIAAGAISLGGAPTSQARATAAGSITLGGAATSGVPSSTAAGSITLAGSAQAQARATAAGVITLSGAETPSAVAGALLGTITLGGAESASAVISGAGNVTLGGAVTGAGGFASLGSIALAGAVVARGAASPLVGVVILTGTTTGRGAVTAPGGLIVIGGAVTAQVPATVAGAIFLNGLATVYAVGWTGGAPLTGTVLSPRYSGIILSKRLSGTVFTPKLTGAVRSPKLTGTIDYLEQDER
jgi:hypothetical protein